MACQLLPHSDRGAFRMMVSKEQFSIFRRKTLYTGLQSSAPLVQFQPFVYMMLEITAVHRETFFVWPIRNRNHTCRGLHGLEAHILGHSPGERHYIGNLQFLE